MDLPPDVADAAMRLAMTDDYPARERGDYLESTHVVLGVDQGEHEPPRARCFGPRDALDRAHDMLADGIPYVLIQRL